MSKLLGVFDLLPDLDKITDEEILTVLKTQIDHHSLENYLGNRIIYPQSVAVNKSELDIDFAILEVALNKHPEIVYKRNQNQVFIPYQFIPRYPPLTRLISIIITSLRPEQITQLWVSHNSGTELIGSILPDTMLNRMRLGDLENLMVKDELKKMVLGELNLLPVTDKQIKIKFSEGVEFDCFGGSLGILIDLRFARK